MKAQIWARRQLKVAKFHGPETALEGMKGPAAAGKNDLHSKERKLPQGRRTLRKTMKKPAHSRTRIG